MSGNHIQSRSLKTRQIIQAIKLKVGNNSDVRIARIKNSLGMNYLSDDFISFILQESNLGLFLNAACFFIKEFDYNQISAFFVTFPHLQESLSHADDIITKILNDNNLFLQLVFNNLKLKDLVTAFPTKEEMIIMKVLKDKNIFLARFYFLGSIYYFLEDFPNYENAIAKVILEDSKIFYTFCDKEAHLRNLQSLFPKHKERFARVFKVLNTPLKNLLTNIINTQDIALFNELNNQLSRAPAYSTEEKRFLKEAKEQFLNLSKAQGLHIVLKDNREWQDAKTQFLNHCEPTLVKKLVGFFKDNSDKKLLEETKKACPQDLKDLLDGPRLSEALRMA